MELLVDGMAEQGLQRQELAVQIAKAKPAMLLDQLEQTVGWGWREQPGLQDLMVVQIDRIAALSH